MVFRVGIPTIAPVDFQVISIAYERQTLHGKVWAEFMRGELSEQINSGPVGDKLMSIFEFGNVITDGTLKDKNFRITVKPVNTHEDAEEAHITKVTIDLRPPTRPDGKPSIISCDVQLRPGIGVEEHRALLRWVEEFCLGTT